jgi:hypothetical protein
MIKRLERLKNTVNEYMADLTTTSTYDLPVRTGAGHKSTTRCTNKIVHQLLSRIICVMVVMDPTPIHSIAYIHHPATPPPH